MAINRQAALYCTFSALAFSFFLIFIHGNSVDKTAEDKVTKIASQPAIQNKEEHPAAAASTVQKNTEQNNKSDSEASQENRQQHLARLIEQRFTPAMKQKINQLLSPTGKTYHEKPAVSGGMVDLSGRASSVTIAVIDDNGDLIVSDITSPLPEQSPGNGTEKQ